MYRFLLSLILILLLTGFVHGGKNNKSGEICKVNDDCGSNKLECVTRRDGLGICKKKRGRRKRLLLE